MNNETNDKPGPASRSARRWLSIPLLLLLCTLAATACQGGDGDGAQATANAAEEPPERPARLVETARLEPVTAFDDHIELIGVTEPLLGANVAPEIGGRILEIDLVEGEQIEEGATVLVTDTSTQSARIRSLDVQVDQLDRDIERAEKLVERGLATRADLEGLQSQRDVMKRQIQEVRVGKRQAVTKAPISGIVTRRDAEPGEFANGGQSVGRIIDISTIVVRVGLPESDIRYVEQGQEVEIHIESLGRTLTGTLHRIGLEANPNNRTFPLEIHIANEDLGVRAGMRATVRLVRQRYDNAIVVPRDAIVQSLDGAQVFVIDDKDQAAGRPVELGPGLVRFVVVKKGLSPGDRLVVRGQRTLVQGEPVEIVTEQPCCVTQLDSYLNPEADTAAATPDTTAPVDPDAAASDEANTAPSSADAASEASSSSPRAQR